MAELSKEEAEKAFPTKASRLRAIVESIAAVAGDEPTPAQMAVIVISLVEPVLAAVDALEEIALAAEEWRRQQNMTYAEKHGIVPPRQAHAGPVAP